VRRTNIFSPEFDHSSDREGYRWRGLRVGRTIGSKRMGASLYELADGERSYPYHFHHGIEELLIVLEGAPVLRGEDGERTLRAGDVVSFPTGPAGAHQVRGPGRVLILSSSCSPETVEYPDSGKVGARPPGKIFRLADATDYWEGE
jgi:uncharacterized cupin superfamily protein